ncbi:MAG: hypothetical protein U9Q71_06855 [Pseudomonadota bacterium]|nr:hypothetical protein [Pseudomonadota bacterium]
MIDKNRPCFARHRALALPLCLLSLAFSHAATAAQSFVPDVRIDQGEEWKPTRGWLPYALVTDELDTVIGAGAGVSGVLNQRQASLWGTGYYTSNESWLLLGSLNDYRLPGTERLFFGAYGKLSHFTERRLYAGYSDEFPGERAGSNDSDKDNFRTAVGDDNEWQLSFKYVLPLGSAREEAVRTHVLDRGELASAPDGGETWNPLASGGTLIELRPFYRHGVALDEEGLEGEVYTNGLRLALQYDNRDFPADPSAGSVQRFEYVEDYGWSNSTDSWSLWSLDLRKYFGLGSNRWLRKQVIALDARTAYSSSWDERSDGTIRHRPPGFLDDGTSLGGYMRLRGYAQDRFRDKASIYYSAEYRVTPQWNPFREMPVINYFEIDWWQLALFGELGRVAPSWDLGDLHSDMKPDVGIDLRFMTKKAVVRVGLANGDDGTAMWAMVNHPF